MWLVPLMSLLAVSASGFDAVGVPASAFGTIGGSPASTADLPKPIATRQTLFSIPFRVERPTEPSEQPVEVQLYASADRGSTWHAYSKADPARQHFLFRAGRDGEYWFQVRTLDKAGRLRPEQGNVPGLRVIVDTSPPQLQVEAQRGPAGQIVTRWQVRDNAMKPDGLALQYRASPAEPWQTVALGPQNWRIDGDVQTGEVTWWLQTPAPQLQIRAEVTDLAGNPAVSHAQIHLSGEQAVRPDAPSVSSDPAAPWRQNSPVGAGIQPPIANRYEPPQSSRSEVEPAGERPRMVNSRLFELQYDVDSVGTSGIARVELFGTRDGGRSWRSYALDEDNRSPLLVTVDEEGYYGFRIVVTNGAGAGGRPPQNGDPPEIVVGVDLTRPIVEITGVQQGSGPEAGKLIIAWKAEDKMLAPRPVSLLFSETPGGPWTTLAAGLENTGRYAWALDARLPPRIYLRLEVRDESGNVGEFEIRDAIVLGSLQPAVRVRDIHPVGQTTRGQPEPQRYYLR